MRIAVAVVVMVAIGLVLASPARATDKETFAKRVGKYATVDPSKPKGLCWCKDGFPVPGNGEAGYVVQQDIPGGAVVLSCMIPEFNVDGSFLSYVTCFVEWDMLGK